MSTRRVFRALALGALLTPLAAVAQTPQPTITGRVTDAASGQPIAAAQVGVVGTTIGGLTSTDGRYVLRGVRPGPVEVRVLRVGFAEQRRTVTVAAGEAATADFTMRPVAVSLTPVVTTATGEERTVEVGNAIARVDAATEVAERPVAKIEDILTARTPGVQVLPATQTGTGTRVRIRGTSSLSLTNNPIYIIDGVRVESSTGSSSLSVGGSTVSRVGDINPEEIESIEVVRGPSAATLYGTDAANGVIVIRTKRGIAGRPQWTYYTEQGVIRDLNDYPDNYRGWTTGSTAGNATQCTLTATLAATNPCVQDSVTTFNVFADPETTPYRGGRRQQHGLQLSGGSETVRYFLHGEWEDEDGVTEVPEFEQRYLATRGLSLREEQRDPNRLGRKTARANLNISLPRNAELAVGLGYTSQNIRLPISDDFGAGGLATNLFGGAGFKYNTNPQGDTLYGWRTFTPRDIYQEVTEQNVDRTIGTLNANWRALEWLTLRGNLGLDFALRGESQLCRFGDCPATAPTDTMGFKRDNRSRFLNNTVDLAATGSARINDAVQSRTTLGAQYYRSFFSRNGAQGLVLPPGITTVTSGATKQSDETSTEARTLGVFIEEHVAIRDRLFLTGALRSDQNSAFGTDFQSVLYPKLAASWVVSEEGFFPSLGVVNQLRLRAAYGASGVQPGPNDALPYYVAITLRGESGDAAGTVISTLGNRDLKPERSAELEVGVDGTFWNNRVSVELTRYDKRSSDALIERVLPPSLGTNINVRLENIGKVRNWGWEGLVTAQLLQREAFGWDVLLNASSNSNEIQSLGEAAEIVTSSTIRQVEGYPINGWWARDVSHIDKDGNGIITYNADTALSEVYVTDAPVFIGYSQPRREVSFINGVDLFRRRVRLSALLDYKGGHKQYFNTERIRCASRANCRGLLDRTAPLDEQARVVAVREHPSRTAGGFIEDADFIRFRELALTLTAPDRWAHALRGQRLSLNLAARNLGILWTKYSGVDPESTYGATGDSPSDFQSPAPPSYFTARLTIGF